MSDASTPVISPVTARFAPSPSGYLHLGNARTALLSYLAARHVGGRFVLRVEDTDEARSEEIYLQSLLSDLRWFGLTWDEGPDMGGPHAPYRQRDRRATYDAQLQKLDGAGLTYPCYCTNVELNIVRRSQLNAGQPPRYAGTCRNLTPAQRADKETKGLQGAIRFRVPAGKAVTFRDVVHGEQRFMSDDIGDFIIRRADGSAAFFFSNAIDDALMGITLVLRGDDHLANTPRQLMLLDALGLPKPDYAHVALLLGLDGSPLSKRHGSTSLHEFRERGFLPEALRNHLVRLGHACGIDGFMDDAAMIADFKVSRLGRAAAKFDEVQLRHWQKEAVAALSPERLQAWLAPQLPQGLPPEELATFCTAVRGNVEVPADVAPWVEVVFGKKMPIADDARAAIQAAGADFFTTAASLYERSGPDIKALTKELGAATGKKGPALYMPLRAALTGVTHGPELGPILKMLWPEKVVSRFQHAKQIATL
ncbi:MAG TPA: glutamate--tRNA ligase [Steroidobacteraceae bacterium]|nr:glutamate--tRNA ligase [Steroidobacteraceae bacterium]